MIAKLRALALKRSRRLAVIIVVLVSVGTIGAMRLMSRPPAVPTAEVKTGEFVDSLQLRGEMKALRSIPISCPADTGDLQIVKIASDGVQVNKGDVIVEFDKTKTEQDLAQYRSVLKAARAEIEQARAQARLKEEANLTAVVKARYEVETAKLDASKQEIVSRIDGEEAKLKLADAEQKLREAEQKQRSEHVANQAALESKIKASEKALYDVRRAELSLEQMTLRAPAAGLISLVQLWRGEGQAAFKPGDRAWPGAPLAELPDISTLRVAARVDETERSRLRPGQPVTVQLDAVPDRQFTGRIADISTIATMDFNGGWPFPRNFNLLVMLDQSDDRLRPGMNGQLNVVVDRVTNVLTVPTQASFQKSGRVVAYALDGSRFHERVIEVGRRSRDRILVTSGLRAGERVALMDPTIRE